MDFGTDAMAVYHYATTAILYRSYILGAPVDVDKEESFYIHLPREEAMVILKIAFFGDDGTDERLYQAYQQLFNHQLIEPLSDDPEEDRYYVNLYA